MHVDINATGMVSAYFHLNYACIMHVTCTRFRIGKPQAVMLPSILCPRTLIEYLDVRQPLPATMIEYTILPIIAIHYAAGDVVYIKVVAIVELMCTYVVSEAIKFYEFPVQTP